MQIRTSHKLAIAIIAALALAGCGTIQRSPDPGGFGFLNGLWDGITILFAWVASWFSPSVALYSWDSDGWYDLGFLIGLVALFGVGASATSSDDEPKKD